MDKGVRMNRKKLHLFRFTIICTFLICGFVALSLVLRAPKRIQRSHATEIPLEYKFLTETITFSKAPGEKWLTKKEVEADLDELEWILENCYSYLHRKNVDYKTALDAIRFSVKDQIKRSQLAWKINKAIALFGDGHSRVKDPDMKWFSSQHLPFLMEEYQGRHVAFKEDRTGFVDPDYPFITKIRELPVSRWLQETKESIPDASEQFVKLNSVRHLRHYGIFRRELGLNQTKLLQVQLESEDGKKHITANLPFVKDRLQYKCWPERDSQILTCNIGYLRLAPFMDFRQEFSDMIVQNMNDFKNTQGLIIDIRGNGGGARNPLNVLFPFFMKPQDEPHIVNVAAYRDGVKRKECRERFKLRFLYPADSPHWTSAEKAVIQKHAKTFKPEWVLPKGSFSPWYYFVISPPLNDEQYYYYDKPVVILMESRNFSACDIFLGAFKGFRNVTLLGTPSGGGSGSAIKYCLHHSDIKVKLSSMASFRPNGKLYEGNGIHPDVLCEPVPTDAIGQTDTILKKAKEIFHKKNNGGFLEIALITRSI
jgi:hypothetical protein